MGVSARILGGDYGLNAQEMNLLLKNEGFLDGDAGDYVVTPKGAPFAIEKDFHRGFGGYDFYNRYWTQRTWDESIKDVLEVTPEKKQMVRDAVAMARKEKWNAILKERAEASAAFRTAHPEFFSEEVSEKAIENASHEASKGGLSGGAIAGIVVGGVFVTVATGYGIYKVVKHLRKRHNKRRYVRDAIDVEIGC